MSLLATDKGGDFELTPAGAHVARCYSVVDLGMQETSFGTKRRVRISWELPDERMQDGRPFSVSKNYTLSLNEKSNLAADLAAWRGRPFSAAERKGFDVHSVLGATCMLNVVHNESGDRTFANVASISPLPKRTECPPAINKPLAFSTTDYTAEQYAALPDWLKDRIVLPTETKASRLPPKVRNVVNSGGFDPGPPDGPGDDGFVPDAGRHAAAALWREDPNDDIPF